MFDGKIVFLAWAFLMLIYITLLYQYMNIVKDKDTNK